MVSEAPMAAGTVLTAALCKKSNRVARALAYALLEWILIALLLANGVFSYIISRFAAFFGLAPPCALCSRLGVDSLFEPSHHGQDAGAEPLRRVLCDAHAAVVSRLGYCHAHRRLADARDMCEDCASAAAASSGKALLSWMRRSELGERDLACACCGVALESGFISPPFLFPTPVACDMDCGHKRDAAVASLNADVVFVSEEGPVIDLFDEKPLMEDDPIAAMAGLAAQCAEIVGNVLQLVPLESADSSNVSKSSVSSQSHGEWKEAIDHVTLKQRDVVLKNTDEEKSVVASDDDKVGDMVGKMINEEITAFVLFQACVVDGFNCEIVEGENAEGFADQQFCEEDSGLKDKSQEKSIVSEIPENEQGAVKHESFSMLTNPGEHEFAIDSLEGNTETVHQADLNNGWNSMPMEAAVHVSETLTGNTEEEQVQQTELSQESNLMLMYSGEHADEEIEEVEISLTDIKQGMDSVTNDSLEEVHVISNDGTKENQAEQSELKHASTFMTVCAVEYVTDSCDANICAGNVDRTEAALPSLHQISYGPSTSLNKSCPDYNDIESERAPDTPTHIEDINGLQELLDHKAMTSDTKSVDLCIAAIPVDLESIELVSVDQLKSALASAHKSLSTLYAELENERSAAAIAADETMAMINRLQEQKAAMQMEAIQYQRLMEEQSEYDHEALQRLNELIVKRDKEKQDLERELELYRRKVHLFEAQERRKMSRYKADDNNGSSSASSSAEDSDDHSQSFYEGDESAHGLNANNGSIPTDAVLQETARHLGMLGCSLADLRKRDSPYWSSSNC